MRLHPHYYNEFDKYAAQWLRNLIDAGHIAPGDVDDRSISDVRPSDLVGYTQCHFFAGIGGWSLALRLAGWPDDRPVWTGSCPCQPFSVAGQGAGVADERHLWPHWFHLIRAVRPPTVFGEQVEAAVNHGWLDLVQDDMEGEGYAFAPIGIPAAGVGAPHIRQRLWFVADSRRGSSVDECGPRHMERIVLPETGWSETADRLGIDCVAMLDQLADHHQGSQGREPVRQRTTECTAGSGRMAGEQVGVPGRAWESRGTSPWSRCDWLPCRDGKWRPVEPGTFPLAHGVSNRVGRLRAYGNAIVPQVAAEVIRAYMECRPC
jgi:DNA (cytosine-5)-methyltransferase 1